MNKQFKGFGEVPQHSPKPPELRRVLIGTPALDGRVDIWFTDSL